MTPSPKNSLFQNIEQVIEALPGHDRISPDRKTILAPLISYIQRKVDEKEDVRINFICTHNSRRSHLNQIWAQGLSHYFGIKTTCCYSAGTEATAVFPMVIETLKRSGFKIGALSEGINPVYAVKFADNEPPVIAFSKTLDHDFNPKSHFVAVMTCSHADEGCPFVSGAEKRIPITYEDPKAFDDTPLQAEKYEERSIQIANELHYVFSQIQL